MSRPSRGAAMLAALGHKPPPLPKRVQQQEQEDLALVMRVPASPTKDGASAERQSEASSSFNPWVLPAEFALLKLMYDAMMSGRAMLKRRGEKVTYANLKPVVEAFTHREFRVEHIAQMKYVHAEAFDWEYVQVANVKDPRKAEYQLLLTFERVHTAFVDRTGKRMNETDERRVFHACVDKYAQDNMEADGSVPPVPQAPLPSKETAISLTRTLARASSLNQGTLQHAMGPASAAAAAANGPSITGVSGVNGPAAGAAPRLQHAASCPLAAFASPSEPSRAKAMQGLTLLLPPDGSSASAATDDCTPPKNDQGLGQPLESPTPLPSQQQQQSQPQAGAKTPTAAGGSSRSAYVLGLLSPMARQQLQVNAANAALLTPEARLKQDERRAVVTLPQAHDLVRAVFGPSGPCIRPLQEVAQMMVSRTMDRSGLTQKDALNMITALSRAVPEFLQVEAPVRLGDGSVRPHSVRVERAASLNATMAKLKSIASEPDKHVQALMGAQAGRGGAAPAPSPVPAHVLARAQSAGAPAGPAAAGFGAGGGGAGAVAAGVSGGGAAAGRMTPSGAPKVTPPGGVRPRAAGPVPSPFPALHLNAFGAPAGSGASARYAAAAAAAAGAASASGRAGSALQGASQPPQGAAAGTSQAAACAVLQPSPAPGAQQDPGIAAQPTPVPSPMRRRVTACKKGSQDPSEQGQQLDSSQQQPHQQAQPQPPQEPQQVLEPAAAEAATTCASAAAASVSQSAGPASQLVFSPRRAGLFSPPRPSAAQGGANVGGPGTPGGGSGKLAGTPHRTAVQEAMARRSSAKKAPASGSRLAGAAGVGGGMEAGAMMSQPGSALGSVKRRRLNMDAAADAPAPVPMAGLVGPGAALAAAAASKLAPLAPVPEGGAACAEAEAHAGLPAGVALREGGRYEALSARKPRTFASLA